jgi:hypothetical protein
VTKSHEWLGVFESTESQLPLVVTMTTQRWLPQTTSTVGEIELGPSPQFTIMSPSQLLRMVEEPHLFSQMQGVVRRVRII